jgi:hypothetical protein
MKASAFYVLLDGQPHGPYSKDELTQAAYAGQVSLDTLYSYERARKWRPLSHLVGEIDPLVVEKNLQKYFIARNGISDGPFSYNELERMLRRREITHETLYVPAGEQDWKPVAKLPLPAIPNPTPPEGIPHESEWREKAKEEVIGEVHGIRLTMKSGVFWTDDEYYLWQVHGPKSSSAGKMYMGGPVTRETLRKMLADGELRPNSRCAKRGGTEWLMVRDFV